MKAELQQIREALEASKADTPFKGIVEKCDKALAAINKLEAERKLAYFEDRVRPSSDDLTAQSDVWKFIRVGNKMRKRLGDMAEIQLADGLINSAIQLSNPCNEWDELLIAAKSAGYTPTTESK